MTEIPSKSEKNVNFQKTNFLGIRKLMRMLEIDRKSSNGLSCVLQPLHKLHPWFFTVSTIGSSAEAMIFGIFR